MTTPGEHYAMPTAATGAPAAAATLPEYTSPINVGMLSQTTTRMNDRGDDNSFAENKRATSTWEERYEQLKQFRQDNGHCLVPGRYKENPPLGRWVESQRKQYHQYIAAKEVGTPGGCAITGERVALLEAIGFAWTVRKTKRSGSYKAGLSWEQRLEQLKAFKQANGHCNIPYQYDADPSFGRWAANQRNAKKALESGAYSSMTEERIAQLNAIGFEWTPPKSRKSMSSSPAKFASSSLSAAALVPDPEPAQVTAMEEEAGTVAAAAAPPAPHGGYFEGAGGGDGDALGMDQGDDGGFAPPPDDDDDDPQAGESQSKNSARAPIKKRAPREKKAPRGDFGNKENKRKVWNERFEELKAYKQQHGNCNVPGRCKEHPSLGRWVETQRKQYHRYMKAKEEGRTESYNFAIGMDEEERISKLSEIGFCWSVRAGQSQQKARSDRPKLSWNQRLVQLKAYKEDHGDCLVPNNYPTCPSLGIWVANQRTWKRIYDAAKAEAEDVASVTVDVKEDRIRQLEAIGFDWAPPRAPRKRRVELSSDNAPVPKRKKSTRSKKSRKTSKESSTDDEPSAAGQEEKSDEATGAEESQPKQSEEVHDGVAV